MKLSTMSTMLFILFLVLIVFQNVATVDPERAGVDYLNNSYSSSNQSSGVSIVDKNGNSVFYGGNWFLDSLLNPSTFFTKWFLLVGIVVGICSLLLIGSALIQSMPTDTVLFAVMYFIIGGMGIVPLGMLFEFILAEGSSMFCEIGSENMCALPTWLAFIIVVPLMINWILVVIKGWRTGSE